MLDKRSMERMAGIHADLARVVFAAAASNRMDFIVTEGLRSLDKQKALVAAGASTTMHSRHLTGHAVDLAVRVDGDIRWDWPLYTHLAQIVKAAAAQEKVPLEWGGDWTMFNDGPHFQLPRKEYP